MICLMHSLRIISFSLPSNYWRVEVYTVHYQQILLVILVTNDANDLQNQMCPFTVTKTYTRRRPPVGTYSGVNIFL